MVYMRLVVHSLEVVGVSELSVALVAEHKSCNDDHHCHSSKRNDEEEDPPVGAHKRKRLESGIESGFCAVKGGGGNRAWNHREKRPFPNQHE